MSTPSVARNHGESRRRSSGGMHDASEVASAWHGRSRWRATMFLRSIFALVAITSALMFMGCPGSDDDDGTASETFSQGSIANDFRNVMPLVNERGVVFSGGVMGAAGPATMNVTGFETCDEFSCGGNFTLDGGDGSESEGDSGGEDSCFFVFLVSDIRDDRVDCGTCALEVVETCVVRESQQTQCRVRWLLAVAEDVAPENAAASEPFDVTLTLEDGQVIAILPDGERVPLIDEDTL